MGTRHFIGIIIDGEWKLAQYGQWDGYPEGQGEGVASFLMAVDIDLFKEKVRATSAASAAEVEAKWVECGATPGSSLVGMDVSRRFQKKYPLLHRSSGSDTLRAIMDSDGADVLADSVDFTKDSLFCEWAYVVDLDNDNFEVFEGFQQEHHTDGRFASDEPNDGGYYPVRLVATIPFSELDGSWKMRLPSEDGE